MSLNKITGFGEVNTNTDKKAEEVSMASTASKVDVDRKPVFGIDLGTTNSAISCVAHGSQPTTIKLDDGSFTMPSCVMWKDGKWIVGREAYINRFDTKRVIYSVKRLMQDVNATITLEDNGNFITLTPAEVSAKILAALVEKAGTLYGKIEDVVVTVPAYFDQNGIRATREACDLAGLNLIAIAQEPTAASLCYDLLPTDSYTKDIIVYDLGGGTFDISLVRITDSSAVSDVDDIYGLDDEDTGSSLGGKVLSVIDNGGSTNLGGDDVDKCMLDHLYRKLQQQGVNTDLIPETYREELILRLESCKKSSATASYVTINMDTELLDGTRLTTSVQWFPEDTYDTFIPVYNNTRQYLNQVLQRTHSDADTIVLVGGSTKHFALMDLLKRDYPSFHITPASDVDLVVSQGAAIYGQIYKFGSDACTIFDILPISIGILTNDISVSKVITRGTQLPVVKSSFFSTTVDDQTEVDVQVYQGESNFKDDCVPLGTIRLTGIKPRPAGEPNLAVTISISADRQLKCTAVVDGISKDIVLDLTGDVTNSKTLTRDEKLIKRWRATAEKLDPEDREQLISLIDQYPSVSKETVMGFIREHRKA